MRIAVLGINILHNAPLILNVGSNCVYTKINGL